MPSITLTIPAEKFDDFKAGYLRINPVPIDRETGQPTMTESEWIEKSIKDKIRGDYKLGKERIAREATVPQIDENIIE